MNILRQAELELAGTIRFDQKSVAGSHYFWGLVRNLEIQSKKGDNSEVPGGRKRNIVVLGGLSALLSLRGGSWKKLEWAWKEEKIGKELGCAWGEKVDCWAVVEDLPPVWERGGCAWPVLVHLRRNIGFVKIVFFGVSNMIRSPCDRRELAPCGIVGSPVIRCKNIWEIWISLILPFHFLDAYIGF